MSFHKEKGRFEGRVEEDVRGERKRERRGGSLDRERNYRKRDIEVERREAGIDIMMRMRIETGVGEEGMAGRGGGGIGRITEGGRGIGAGEGAMMRRSEGLEGGVMFRQRRREGKVYRVGLKGKRMGSRGSGEQVLLDQTQVMSHRAGVGGEGRKRGVVGTAVKVEGTKKRRGWGWGLE